MADLEQRPADSDAPYAALLNGVMVILLGVIFTGFLACRMVAELTGRLPT
ncbi:MAG: hypothetical protein J7521_06280 [Caulobacter sp.]|nr:hypothetical protein [Caulobacter sp.]